MKQVPVISSRAELLLTSGGTTTDAMKERLLAMGRIAGNTSKINVLRLADGWQPFDEFSQVGLSAQVEHQAESLAARLWSRRYLRWCLGKRATISTETIGSKSPAETRRALSSADLLLIPGGNTYQTIRYLGRCSALIQEAIADGLPYVGESAGSIIAGKTVKPASLEPADTCPDPALLGVPGLNLIEADVVVHARGEQSDWDIKDPLARVTKMVLESVASDSATYQPDEAGTVVYALTETQALSVSHGKAQLI